jgi:adenylate kinase
LPWSRRSQLLDYLELLLNPPSGPAPTGFIIDHHSPSLFPERWIDLAVVYTCPNDILYQRLADRGYEQNKITENVTAEIMQTVLEETRESYAEEIVVVLESSGVVEGEMEGNMERVQGWVERWIEEGAGKGHEGVEDREEREEREG